MRSAVLVFAVALAAACAAPQRPPPAKPFTGTRWQVQLELPIPGEQPYLRFGDGRVEGFGGCNRIAARYLQDAVGARAIAIGRVQRGRRACDPSRQAVENHLLDVLSFVSSYSITGDVMNMSGSAGSLRLRAVEERP